MELSTKIKQFASFSPGDSFKTDFNEQLEVFKCIIDVLLNYLYNLSLKYIYTIHVYDFYIIYIYIVAAGRPE